jgi:hypothetical protein
LVAGGKMKGSGSCESEIERRNFLFFYFGYKNIGFCLNIQIFKLFFSVKIENV